MTIEDAIRHALAADGLSHLTLTPSKDRWQAAYKPGSGGYRVAIYDDPVEALIEALSPGAVQVRTLTVDADILDLIG
jgi:hypothetical protein